MNIPERRARGRRALIAGGVALAAGCGGGQTRGSAFSTEFRDDGGAAVASVIRRLARVKAAPGANLAVLISRGRDRVRGIPLDGSAPPWVFEHALDGRPFVAGAVVVVSGGGSVLGLDAKSGKVLWRRPTGGTPLRGAGDDGNVTVMTFSAILGDGRGGSRLLAVARDGTVVRQVETDAALFVPTVLGGLAFVPWAGTNMSVFDLTNGDEAARLVLSQPVTRAYSLAGEVYFGGASIVRFDPSVARAAHGVAAPSRSLPGGPQFFQDERTNAPLEADRSAETRLYARPVQAIAGGGLALAGGVTVMSHGRAVVALTAAAGERTAWARAFQTPILGGAVGDGFFVACEASGHLSFLELSSGETIAEKHLGEMPRACDVQVDGMRPPGAVARASANRVSERIGGILQDPDPDLTPVKSLLLSDLAQRGDAAATGVLVSLVTEPGTEAAVAEGARRALEGRTAAIGLLVAALVESCDPAARNGRVAPAGGGPAREHASTALLAKALGRARAASAAAPLAACLLEPAVSDEAIDEIAHALVAVAGPAEAPALHEFFVLNRASASTAPIVDAARLVAGTLTRIGGAAEAKVVRALLDDPGTVEALRAGRPTGPE